MAWIDKVSSCSTDRNVPNRMGSIISKESIPTIPTLEKLCSAFGITLAQFFSNEESHPNLTETQREILMIWDSLDVEERKVFMTMIRGLKK